MAGHSEAVRRLNTPEHRLSPFVNEQILEFESEMSTFVKNTMERRHKHNRNLQDACSTVDVNANVGGQELACSCLGDPFVGGQATVTCSNSSPICSDNGEECVNVSMITHFSGSGAELDWCFDFINDTALDFCYEVFFDSLGIPLSCTATAEDQTCQLCDICRESGNQLFADCTNIEEDFIMGECASQGFPSDVTNSGGGTGGSPGNGLGGGSSGSAPTLASLSMVSLMAATAFVLL